MSKPSRECHCIQTACGNPRGQKEPRSPTHVHQQGGNRQANLISACGRRYGGMCRGRQDRWRYVPDAQCRLPCLSTSTSVAWNKTSTTHTIWSLHILPALYVVWNGYGPILYYRRSPRKEDNGELACQIKYRRRGLLEKVGPNSRNPIKYLPIVIVSL